MSDDDFTPDVVHVVGEPVDLGRKVVQQCTRCGFVIEEFDRDNPPRVEADAVDKSFAWWPPGYLAVRGSGRWAVPEDNMDAADVAALCEETK